MNRSDAERIRSQFGEVALEALAEAMAGRLQTRAKAVSATASQNYLHGPGSLLGVLGLPQAITNAMVLPVKGLQAELPYMRSDMEDQMFTILTGQTASTGSEPTSNCADSKQPGQLKECTQIWPFGRIQLDTQVLDVSMTGRLINRGEFIDQTLIGNPWSEFPQAAPLNPQEALKNDVSKKILELWVAMYRDYGHLNYDGNPVNTSASSGGYLEWAGLDQLINTNYWDVVQHQLCPAADSLVVNFGSVTMDANAGLLVLQLSEMVRAQKYLAERTGQAPVKFALAMRYSAFLKLTEVWPCAYFTTMCTNLATGSTQFVEAQRQIDLRNDMRKGMYVLTIFGDQIPVIIDDFITETIPTSSTFQSDIYLIPLTTGGGRPVTYFQFFNWDGPNSAVAMGAQMAPAGTYTTWAGGQFLVVKKMPTNTCTQIQVIKKQRLILETPFLAARLTNVRYTVMDHERDFTGGTPAAAYGYQPNGGVYYNPSPYWYPSH